MYDELVKRLRNCATQAAPCKICDMTEDVHCSDTLMKQAADAIEELAAFKAQITDGRFYCMRDGVLYEAKVEPPKGKVFQLPPIEFAEEGDT